MSGGKIDIDLAGIKNQLNTFSYIVGDLKGALSGFPTAADAGSASSELSAIGADLKAKAERVVFAEEGLSDLVLEVANDLLSGDEEAADVFKKLKDVLPDG
ncbi:hypothetical protein G7066_14000 [Leucobacter coleopterorum]|uniref:Excreted virulence factor EspC, type VII ESX diderm n=1 Tax=Leucobacter coleopterorum TaxID=2714933 RepID=A0ABX6K2M3_9MICO|nr:hypothetical protein [Leucobacter coleopterorum]QIM19410.1 hypothetical protein G7066_14000 [Leucobacter coleopterorum]